MRNPQRTIKIDRDRAGILGVTADQIRNALYNAFGTRQISTIYTPSNDYQVIIQANADFQADPTALVARLCHLGERPERAAERGRDDRALASVRSP